MDPRREHDRCHPARAILAMSYRFARAFEAACRRDSAAVNPSRCEILNSKGRMGSCETRRLRRTLTHGFFPNGKTATGSDRESLGVRVTRHARRGHEMLVSWGSLPVSP